MAKTTMKLTQAKFKALKLATGAHPDRSNGLCVMEVTAWLANEPHSDKPACVSPVIAAFMRQWNDDLDDATRQKLLPYAKKVIGTATNKKDEEVRAWLCTDWMVRVYAPAWLDLAGCRDQANALRALPAITAKTVAQSNGPLEEAKTKADAARAAAWDAAWDAARAAAWDANLAASKQKLAPTVTSLQASAFELLDAMIAVGKKS